VSTTSEPVEAPRSRGLTARAVKSFGWATVSYGGSKVIVFASTIVLARILTPRDFGVVAAASALLIFFDVALDLGVGAALVYEQEQGITNRVQTAFTINAAISASFMAIGIAITPLVAAFTGLQRYENVFRVLFLALLVRGLGQVQTSVLQRDLRFGRRAVCELSAGVARAAVSIMLALGGLGVWALVWGVLAGEVAGTALSWFLTGFVPRFKLNRAAARAIMGFGLLFVALKVTDAIGMDSDYLVVAHRLGARQVGYYSLGYRLPELALLSLYWIVGSVAFPVFAKARDRGREASVAASLRSLRLITTFSFPAGVLLALMSRDFIGVVFSSKWAPAVGPMELIALMTMVSSMGFASGDLFPASGRPGTLLALNLPLTVLLVAGYVVAAPYGILAVAAVHLILSVFYQAARLTLVNKLLGTTMPEDLRALWPGVCAIGGVLLLAGPLRLFAPPGAVTLLLIVMTGVVGAFAGLAAGSRSTVAELRSLLGLMMPTGTA
jgi:lipopolysaccharide exporter